MFEEGGQVVKAESVRFRTPGMPGWEVGEGGIGEGKQN